MALKKSHFYISLRHSSLCCDTVSSGIANKEPPAHRFGRLWKFNRVDADELVRVAGAGAETDGTREGSEG